MWRCPDLIPHMITSRVEKLKLEGSFHAPNASLSTLSFLTNLPKVRDLPFVNRATPPRGNSSGPLRAPNPSFWHGIRRLALEDQGGLTVLMEVVDWVYSSRLEAGQDEPAQKWGLEYSDIELPGTSDARPVLAKLSTPRITGIRLTFDLRIHLDSSFVSDMAELFPLLKRLFLYNFPGQRYANDLSAVVRNLIFSCH